MSIKVNELLSSIGRRIRKVATGSELLFLYELDKYSKAILGQAIDLTGIQIMKNIQGSEQFSFVVNNGLDVGFTPDRESLADYSKSVRFFFTKTVEGVVFESVRDDEVIYNFDSNPSANLVLHGENRAASYISLVAYLIVKAVKEGKQVPKLIINHEKYTQTEGEYSHLMILKDYGNKLLKDLVDIKYSSPWGLQPEWEAFVIYNRQKGFMNRPYTTTEKYKLLKKHFNVGDVVLYYQRAKASIGKTITKLTACYPAVIQYFDDKVIKITYYPTVATRLTKHVELAQLEEEFEDRDEESIYTQEDYNKFIVCNETISLTEMGVDVLTFVEQSFIIRPIDDDFTYQCFKTPEGTEMVKLSTLDTIYAVFEDRGVNYNKESFLTKYFAPRNRVPVYDTYMQRLQEYERGRQVLE